MVSQFVISALVLTLCLLVPMFVAPVISSIITLRIYNRLKEKIDRKHRVCNIENVDVEDVVSSLNVFERIGTRIVLKLMRRGLSLGMSCRIANMLLSLMICLAIYCVLLPVAILLIV